MKFDLVGQIGQTITYWRLDDDIIQKRVEKVENNEKVRKPKYQMTYNHRIYKKRFDRLSQISFFGHTSDNKDIDYFRIAKIFKNF
jgi:hypothetical protein